MQRRLIFDSITAAFEVIHYIKRKTWGKVGNVALKVDISKAYDRVDLGFLECIMLKLGFDRKWVDLIILCVQTVKYSVRVNNRLVGPIHLPRVLRQGCPLSPYLFVICALGLSLLIDKAIGRRSIQSAKICMCVPIISHLLFADDNLFFFRATISECENMRSLLADSKEAPG